MIKKALLSALRDGYIGYEDLYIKDDYEFHELCRQKSAYPPFSLIEQAEHGRLFERKACRPFSADGAIERKALSITERFRTEAEIYRILKGRYPQLREYEAIIDIPEPISFETEIGILMPGGSISSIAEEGMIFEKAGDLFSRSLRAVALYLPPYVSEEDGEAAFREADNG